MWHPPHVLLPICLEPNPRGSVDAPVAVMWPIVPFEQHQYFIALNEVAGSWDRCVSIEDERKFLLSKAVYDLVKVSHFLELTDPKLLGWYLSISPEDRKLIQDEGGLLKFLQGHPALEVSRHIIHLKQQVTRNYFPLSAPDMSSKPNGQRQVTIHGVSRCVNCGKSCPSGAEKCTRCVTLIINAEENVHLHEEEKTLRLLPNNVRAELNLYKGHVSEDMAMRSSQQSTSNGMFATQSKLLNSFRQPEQPQNNSSAGQLCPLWEEGVHCEGKSFNVFKDQSAQAISQSNDAEMPLQPDSNLDLPNLQEETLSGYYSLNSTTSEHVSAQWSDVTNTSMIATKGSTESSTSYEPVTSGTQNFTDSMSFLSQSSEWTDISEDCQNLSSEDDLNQTKAEEYHSVNEDEFSSSAACPPCVNPSWSASGQSTQGSVSQTVDASSDFRACFTTTRATEISQDFFVKHCQDVSTGTDLCAINQETQIIQRPTSEKCTNTEVYMSDLDAVCEEFGKLKMMEEELMCLKPCAGGLRSKQQESCGCGAVSRARWAELRLLALQFAMCQQHCWRRFYTSQEGETSLQGIRAVPDAMSQTLKSLEESYLKKKRKILEGVPLDNLKPLSVDTKRLSAALCYRPSLIYEAFLSDHLPETSFNLKDEGQTNQAEVLKIIATDHGHLKKNTTALWLDSDTLTETVSSKRSKLVPGTSKPPGVSSDAKHGAPKDLNSSDAWFDAEEELGLHGCSCEEETEPRDHGNSNKEQNVDANRKINQCFLLCVSNLPDTVTESDLLLWFGNYHIDQVSISNFAHTRVAMVSVRNPDDVEAAIREMNGQSVQGHTLHVEHMHKPPADGQVTIKESCSQLVGCAPAAYKAESVGKWLVPQSSDNFNASKHPGSIHCSLDRLTNICTIPTASGTCVPQHYGTMGSFDTIMAKLSERHPKIGRQQIITALLELRAKHHGVLSGIPLRDVIDMTSELLLTQSATN